MLLYYGVALGVYHIGIMQQGWHPTSLEGGWFAGFSNPVKELEGDGFAFRPLMDTLPAGS
jgi:hypothetical protein